MRTDFKTLRVTLNGPVLTVELNRPDHGNAVDGQVLIDLLDLLRALEEDTAVRVVVLSGAGDHFCQGGDRSEFPALLAQEPGGQALRALAARAHRVCAALAELGAVTIARLHGDVIGAGLGLAVFCDLRIGDESCRFRMPEVGLRVPPAWGGVLPRLVEEAGRATVRKLLLTSEEFDAEKAEKFSILHEVVPVGHLNARVDQVARLVARRDPATVQITKRMLSADAHRTAGLLDEELLTAAISRQSSGSRGRAVRAGQ
ncbi:enoyl-CoA hydratase/isomerase family protein [Streptomyces sp. NPDC048566]|uniref:enoyl-CoA hydratase/isomerase family protein n=1 Tax=Streptomyces sp. NPDC048566 TaxID=3365569 RepID=UPI003717BC10